MLSRASRISSSARPLPFFDVTAILGVAVRRYGIENNISCHRAFFSPSERNMIHAAGYKRITAKYPIARQNKSYEKATFLKGLKAIGRACRRKPTARAAFERGQKFAVKAYQ